MSDVEISEVQIDSQRLTVGLSDGRTVSVPLDFYPTLQCATDEERRHFEKFPCSIYWPELDCDLGIEGLLRGARELPVYAERGKRRAAERAAFCTTVRPDHRLTKSLPAIAKLSACITGLHRRSRAGRSVAAPVIWETNF